VIGAASLAGACARAAWAGLNARPPGGAQLWNRTNHRGETLTLLEGPAYTIGAATAAALAPGLPPKVRAAAVVATLGGGIFGAVDDLRETGKSKGLRGHLSELVHGRVTTGGLKVLGLGVTGLAAAALATSGSHHVGQDPARLVGELPARAAASLGDVVLAGALIAGTANLLNLFDLRPGRALKVLLLFSPAAGRSPARTLVAVATGAAGALLPVDLAEQAMLGDTGANAAGALLGTAAVAGLGRRGRLAALLGVSALTLASERVSFTAVIARTPGLREFDALGRRPPE
jgi:UDP-N-acetylmuramyl pentapeptide phosphotransferase/UDP-N-acetylglucosamine-1-phosphate transferase